MQQSYYVKAVWDSEASVWISETDIPGLVIEAETLDEFQKLMTEFAPQMLAANEALHNVSIPLDFSVCERRQLAVG